MGEDNKPKQMIVEQIKAIEPLADCYQFNTYNRYIVMLKKSNLIGGNENVKQKAQVIYKMFKDAGIPVAIFIGVDDNMTIFEVK